MVTSPVPCCSLPLCCDLAEGEDAARAGLQEAFGECGEIVNMRLPTDRESGELKGIAYIEFATTEGKNAAGELNGAEAAGGYLKVDINVAPRTPGSAGGFGGGRGGFGGRGGGRGFGGDRGELRGMWASCVLSARLCVCARVATTAQACCCWPPAGTAQHCLLIQQGMGCPSWTLSSSRGP